MTKTDIQNSKREKSTNLKENQLLAAQLLATGKTGKFVAEAVGVTEETISRWKKDEDFQLYMAELLIDIHETAKVRLQGLVDRAVCNLEEVINDQNISSKDKFAASIKIIEMCNLYCNALSAKSAQIRDPYSMLSTL
jgi:hypothetical protein